jgi:hypothetical protein
MALKDVAVWQYVVGFASTFIGGFSLYTIRQVNSMEKRFVPKEDHNKEMTLLRGDIHELKADTKDDTTRIEQATIKNAEAIERSRTEVLAAIRDSKS